MYGPPGSLGATVAFTVKQVSVVEYPAQATGVSKVTLPSLIAGCGLVPNPEPCTVTLVVSPASHVPGVTDEMLGVGSPTVKFVEVVHPMLVVTTRE